MEEEFDSRNLLLSTTLDPIILFTIAIAKRSKDSMSDIILAENLALGFWKPV